MHRAPVWTPSGEGTRETGLNGILDDDEQVEDVTSLSDVKTPATGVSIDTPTVASKQASRPGVATQLPSDARGRGP